MNQDCDFCSELHGPTSRFHEYYAGLLATRVLVATQRFAIVPSMGQIVRGSLMLVTRHHVERFADLDHPSLLEAQGLLATLAEASDAVVYFEHGARSSTGGSCGIYHAHVHVVELPPSLTVTHLASDLAPSCESLPECWTRLSKFEEYLLLRAADGRTWTREVLPTERARFPSQYFRRRLATVSGAFERWNWRNISQPEPELIDAFRFWTRRLQPPEHSASQAALAC